MSNALLKSSAMTWTNGCTTSISEMVCSNLISALVVEPVGRKAYWSEKLSMLLRVEKLGYT